MNKQRQEKKRGFLPASYLLILLMIVFIMSVGLFRGAEREATAKKEMADKARVAELYGKLPMYFIQNNGQADEKVRFYEKGSGHATYFTEDGVFLTLIKGEEKEKSGAPDKPTGMEERAYKSELVKLSFLNASKAKITAEGLMDGRVNYFIGKDSNKWKTDIPTYGAVMYSEVYDGVDVKFYGNNRLLEYDIIVKPGAEPSMVRLSYDGIEGLKVTESGDLYITMKEGGIIQKKPYVYQEIEGKRVEIDGRFKIIKEEGKFAYGFEVASYSKEHSLVIDPVLVYSTYLGGSGIDYSLDVAVDTAGNAYLIGGTESSNFPMLNPYQSGYAGNRDVFVAKFNAAGSALIYSTYLGGSDIEHGRKIALDNSGNVYITGGTYSINFPTLNPYQGNIAGNCDVFVAKLSTSGSLLYSTYLGGNVFDWGLGVAVYPNVPDNVYITGMNRSSNFPTTSGAFDTLCGSDGTCDGGLMEGFVAKFDTSQSGASSLIYSAFLGGSGDDFGRNLVADASGNAYVAGASNSTDFPLMNPLQGSNSGDYDLIVTKVNPTGSALVYSTYIGGSGFDRSKGIALDSAGNIYVTGNTASSNFPVLNAYQGSYGGGTTTDAEAGDAFLIKINAAGSSLLYSTYLGGSGNDSGWGIGADNLGNVYITGWTWSTNFPVVNPVQVANAGTVDAIVLKIDTTQSGAGSMVYSTYLGGIGGDWGYGMALDSAGNAYLVGETQSTNFPTMNPFQASHAGGTADVFVTKIAEVSNLAVSKTDSPDPLFAGSPLTYTVMMTNNGPDRATGVTLTDTLPGGVTFVSAISTQSSCTEAAGVVTCTIGNMGNGATVTVTIVVTPTTPGVISNTATVSSPTSDPNAANNSATEQTTVNATSGGGNTGGSSSSGSSNSDGGGGGGCGFIQDSGSKNKDNNSLLPSFMLMIMLTLTGIALARRVMRT